MRGVNKVILIGNLGKDPDLQSLEGNIMVAKFPLATSESRKDKNGNVVSETEWHSIILWRGLAELAAKCLKKGSLIYVEGKLKTRSWEDKQNVRRFQTEIVADSFVMLEKRRDEERVCSEVANEEEKCEEEKNKSSTDESDAILF